MFMIFLLIMMIFKISYQKETANLTENCLIREQQLPSAILIGVGKSGTYALLRYLSVNPQILPALKINGAKLNEINFFTSNESYAKGFEWYKDQMPFVCKKNENDHIVVIEKSPTCFKREYSIERIKDYNKDIKLILVVRDPVKRLQSQLTQTYSRKLFRKKKRPNVKKNEYYESVFKNSSSSVLVNDPYVNSSIYYLYMQKWIKHFKINESIIVIDGEKFIEKPWVELNRLEKFLGVNVMIGEKDFTFNKEKMYYCLKNGDDSCLNKNKGRKYQVYLSDYVKQNLKEYFSKWNSLFFDLIGQRFNW